VPSVGRSANYKCYSTLSLTKQGTQKDSHQLSRYETHAFGSATCQQLLFTFRRSMILIYEMKHKTAEINTKQQRMSSHKRLNDKVEVKN